MKTYTKRMMLMLTMALCSGTVMAQGLNLTVEVKGIKDDNGKILVVAQSCEDAQQMVYGMIEVSEKGWATCTLENLPSNKVDISLFHDLNGNYKLDMDEQNIPIEPCAKKDKVEIKEDNQKISLKLINVKEMMSGTKAHSKS